MDRTRSFRSSEQLCVCYRGQQKGKAASKQRLAHWIVGAITLANQWRSTRSVASSYASAHGTSLVDICRAAGWATPNTFTRVYSLCVSSLRCWVTGKWWEELAGVMLAAPFPLTRDMSTCFLLQYSSPDGEPWWRSSSTPGSQTGRSSLMPGPVLVLACPGIQSAPVLG